MQESFVKARTREPYYEGYKSYVYGGRLIGLFMPMEQIQLSAELEQLRVNQEFNLIDYSSNFWNTALYEGLDCRADHIIIGMRYNVLYD